jgi:hypothetical protein
MSESINVWQQGEAGGHVSEKPSEKFPVRVVGFVHEGEGDLDSTGCKRGHREINRPKFITRVLAEKLATLPFAVEYGDGVIETWSNRLSEAT